MMYVASFLDKVYPGRGMSSSLRAEHMKSMSPADFYKVWKARVPRGHTAQADRLCLWLVRSTSRMWRRQNILQPVCGTPPCP